MVMKRTCARHGDLLSFTTVAEATHVALLRVYASSKSEAKGTKAFTAST
jgi:hypothetical protein